MFRYNQIADMTFSAGGDTHTNGSPMAPFVKKSISVPTCIKFFNKNNIVDGCQLKERTPVTQSAPETGFDRWAQSKNSTPTASTGGCPSTKTTNVKAFGRKLWMNSKTETTC